MLCIPHVHFKSDSKYIRNWDDFRRFFRNSKKSKILQDTIVSATIRNRKKLMMAEAVLLIKEKKPSRILKKMFRWVNGNTYSMKFIQYLL